MVWVLFPNQGERLYHGLLSSHLETYRDISFKLIPSSYECDVLHHHCEILNADQHLPVTRSLRIRRVNIIVPIPVDELSN